MFFYIFVWNRWATEYYKTTDDVLEFSDIACPLLFFQFLDGWIGENGYGFAHLVGGFHDEAIN